MGKVKPWTLINKHTDFEIVDSSRELIYTVKFSDHNKAITSAEREQIESLSLAGFIESDFVKNPSGVKLRERINQSSRQELIDFYHHLTSLKGLWDQMLIKSTDIENNDLDQDDIYNSFSWKIGYAITRVIERFVSWTPWYKNKYN